MRGRAVLLPIAILAILHTYIGWRIVPDLPGGALSQAAGVSVLLSCFGLMMLGLAARALLPRPAADRLAAPGFFMAGLFSSLLVLTLCRDVLLLPALLALSAAPVEILQQASALLVSGLALFVTAAGFVSAHGRARIVYVDIPLHGLPPSLIGFSIAQISDVHVGATIRKRQVEAIVDAVNGLGADIIAITGDLVDGPVSELSCHTAPLARLSARYGAFFVPGNHEYYSGERAWTAEFRRIGLHVLLNEHQVVTHNGTPLVVAGVTDYSAHHFDPEQRSDPSAALSGAPPEAGAKILLAHQPRSAPAAAAAGFDLQLSGHTHGGQFWPWTLFVRLQQPFTAGLHRLNALWVYVSRGTGYWGPPNRFGAPAEITRLRLVIAV